MLKNRLKIKNTRKENEDFKFVKNLIKISIMCLNLISPPHLIHLIAKEIIIFSIDFIN